MTKFEFIEKRQRNCSLITGVPSGFSRLDSLTAGFQKSDLIVLAAGPGMGKTSLALHFARNAVFENGVPVAIFSLKLASDKLSMRMLCSEARVDSTKLKNGVWGSRDWVKITGAAETLCDDRIYIDDSAGISPTTIRAKVRRLKKNHDLGMIIVDNLQLMDLFKNAERSDLAISKMSKALKEIAKEFEIPVVAISQLNRHMEERADKRPMLSDLNEYGALEQNADIVMFIYCEDVYNQNSDVPVTGRTELIVAKNRDGAVGTIALRFVNIHNRFEQAA